MLTTGHCPLAHRSPTLGGAALQRCITAYFDLSFWGSASRACAASATKNLLLCWPLTTALPFQFC